MVTLIYGSQHPQIQYLFSCSFYKYIATILPVGLRLVVPNLIVLLGDLGVTDEFRHILGYVTKIGLIRKTLAGG